MRKLTLFIASLFLCMGMAWAQTAQNPFESVKTNAFANGSWTYHTGSSGSWYGKAVAKTEPVLTVEVNENAIGWSTKDGIRRPWLKAGYTYTISLPEDCRIVSYKLTTQSTSSGYSNTFTYTSSEDGNVSTSESQTVNTDKTVEVSGLSNQSIEITINGSAGSANYGILFTGLEVTYFRGEGTASSPYIIDSEETLVALRNAVNAGATFESKYFKLTSDITLSEAWTAIGNGSRSSKTYTGNAFKGVFDGDNKTISGLTITSTTGDDAAVGLFGVVDGGTVKNLTLTDVNINVSNSDLAGAAIGMMLGGATAENITVNGAVVGNDGVGGIVGRLVIDGTIANCTNNASVTSTYGGIGGIVGKAYYEDGSNTATFASITNCTNKGVVTAPMYVGGIVGLARANVTGCVNEGAVVGGTQTGGIVGQLMAAGNVEGNENRAKVSGKNHLGGIIGDYSQSSAYTYNNVTIKNNINRGELAATEQCAAIMGCNNIDGFTAMTASGNTSYYHVEGLELFGNPEDMVIDATNEFIVPVAEVNNVKYMTLAAAVAAVEDGGTITLIANEVFTDKNRTYNSGTYYDGLYYIGDKSFTVDLGGFTISQDGAVNDYLLNFKNDGAKANVITLKNGTIDAGTTAYCAICTATASTQQITINTENINIINNLSNGFTIKLRGGAVLNVNEGTIITGKDSYLGIECVASTVNIYDGAKIYMNGKTSYNGCLVGACSGGTVNVYGGYGKGVKGGFIAMTSGGTINISDGEWIANTDGSIGDNSNLYVLTSQNNSGESGYKGASIINVTGGTFRGGMDAWILNQGRNEVAELNISGGNFNANPENYLAVGNVAVEDNGVWTVERGLSGAGTEANPYLINSIDDLVLFRNSVNAGETKYNAKGIYVALGADIDLADENWAPIGSDKNHAFKGIFDGQEHTVSNLLIEDADLEYAGLFGYANGATIKNVNVENVDISAYAHVAAIAGSVYTGNVENCHVSGTISLVAQYAYSAGIAADGYVNVRNCSVIAEGTGVITVVEKTGAGGITGWRGEGNLVIENCTVKNLDITAWASLGSISGIVHYDNSVTGCTVENVKLTKTRENGQGSVGVVSGNWAQKADGNYTITVTDNSFTNVEINGTAINNLNLLLGSNYSTYITIPEENFVEENNTLTNVTSNLKVAARTYNDLKLALAYSKDDEVALLAPITIAKDETVVLDLNGKTVKHEAVCTASYQMIYNKGNLTIKNGTLSFKDTSEGDSSFGWGSYTVRNEGTLVVEDATIEHIGEQEFATHCIQAIFNYSGSTTINGGTISTPNYRSIRLWHGDLTINDGVIDGQVWIQTQGGEAATLTVTGGEFSPNGRDGSSIYITNDNNTVVASIEGGKFATKIGVYDTNELSGFITGGQFTESAVTNTNSALIATGYVFSAVGADGYCSVEADPNYIAELVIDDADAEDFVNESDKTVGTLTYKRTLPVANIWMPLYVPFAIPMSELIDNYDVAYFNDVHGFDEDEDNVVERTTIELIKITDSNKTIKANYPLVIRAKSAEAQELELTLNDVVLAQAVEKAVTCTSVNATFEIKGTYIKRETIDENQRVLGMTEDGQAAWGTLADGYPLNPHRLILTITSRDEELPFESIRMRVVGEDNENGETVIYDVDMDSQEDVGNIYDLQGRRVLEPQKGSLYIVNGKKVVIK